MIRLMAIVILITLGLSSCNSIRYSSYNRPFDFVKLQRNKSKSKLETQVLDSVSKESFECYNQNQTIVSPQQKKQTVQIVEPIPKEIDSVNNLVYDTITNPIPIKASTFNQIHIPKGNVLEFRPINKERKTSDSNSVWDDFLLFLLITVIVVIALALIVAYLSSTPTGQIILAGIIILLLVIGIISAIAYNETFILDILELLFLFV